MEPPTRKELQTLQLLADGKSNKQIAYAVEITLDGVEARFEVMLKKWSMPNRAALVALAFRQGWIK